MTRRDELMLDLQRHLATAADPRPVDGQLEAILMQTAALRQDPTWLARWRRRGRPFLPGAPVTLRWIAVAALVLIVVASLATAAGGRPASTPFEGRWTSVDFNSSTQTLVIAAGSSPSIEYEDSFASGCVAGGDPVTRWFGTGAGLIREKVLTVAYDGGGCETWHVGPYVGAYAYDPATDALLDYLGVTWSRAP